MIPTYFDLRNANALWSSVLAETLHRAGVRQVVISPGSRSTALAFAFARHKGFEAIPVLDERSAAFFALGLAKQRLQPVVLVCTSGTAAANYLPAVVEAHEGGVPLLVITADRPPEMRGCASGQTIDQQKIYGGYVSFYHELTVPRCGPKTLRYLRQTVAHAVERTLRPSPGPVHLNAPYRDPLPPLEDKGEATEVAKKIDWTQFFAAVEPPVTEVLVQAEIPKLSPDVHGVIVAGPEQVANPGEYAEHVALLAQRLGWPVLATTLSPVRHHTPPVPHVISTFDTILRNAAAAERLKPEVVLCLGEWPTSKVLRNWIDESDAPIWMLTERADNRDALHGRARHCPVSLAVFANQVPAANDVNGYQRLWESFEQKARVAYDERFEALGEMFEGGATWLLAKHLPWGTPVFAANSMPVRDVDYFWPGNDQHTRLFFNRGANGIDGTLSTALGMAHGAEQPAVLLTGDLALLHDTNGFLLRPRLRGSLTIVLINNRGGGIFEHLPVAYFPEAFEEFFATPQEADFAKLCAAYDVEHVPVRDWGHFAELVSALPASGVRVLEVRTDRKRDAKLRGEWFDGIAASLTI